MSRSKIFLGTIVLLSTSILAFAEGTIIRNTDSGFIRITFGRVGIVSDNRITVQHSDKSDSFLVNENTIICVMGKQVDSLESFNEIDNVTVITSIGGAGEPHALSVTDESPTFILGSSGTFEMQNLKCNHS